MEQSYLFLSYLVSVQAMDRFPPITNSAWLFWQQPLWGFSCAGRGHQDSLELDIPQLEQMGLLKTFGVGYRVNAGKMEYSFEFAALTAMAQSVW